MLPYRNNVRTCFLLLVINELLNANSSQTSGNKGKNETQKVRIKCCTICNFKF